MFHFQPVTPPQSPQPASTQGCISLLYPAFLNKAPHKDLFVKWGFSQDGEWSLHAYNYTYAKQRAPANASDADLKRDAVLPGPSKGTGNSINAGACQAKSVAPAALRFHHGMADSFLRDLFSAPAVVSQLTGSVTNTSSELRFRPLTCHWSTFTSLRQALVAGKVVRQVRPPSEHPSSAEQQHSEYQPDVRLPTVKCAEELLPHGEVICDELRALFLQAHSRSCPSEYSPVIKEENVEVQDGASDGDEYDGDGAWGVMAGAKLPLRQLRGVFDTSARTEFLYHVLWRLIAGGGPLNQFEDDAAVYFDVARQLYRALITSFHVREVAVAAGAAGNNEVDDEEGDVAALESPKKPSPVTRLEAVVDALVYEVFSIPHVQLFPSSDGVTPSNLNYCYVVVNPSEQTVCVWYHHC